MNNKTIIDFIYEEAFLLDTMQWERWLELYASDARYWMPCLLYTSPSPRDRTRSRMPSSA